MNGLKKAGNEAEIPSELSAGGRFFVKCAIPTTLSLILLAPVAAFSSDTPENIDELGFESIFDNNLFSRGLSLKSESETIIGDQGRSSISTTLEAESESSDLVTRIRPLDDNLDDLASEYQSQGLKIKRLSTSWQTESGSLTVGSDWANFQDTLTMDKGFDSSFGSQNRSVASQIRWHSPNGFSISIEDNEESAYTSGDQFEENGLSSPSIILSWQGGAGGNAGEYRVTAMGTSLDSQSSGQKFDGENVIGWGLNLEGGWQIGDLFAALSVTYGKGINSYVLQRFGNEILVTPNDIEDFGDAYSIRPSLYYSLNENSNFHVALGRYASDDGDPTSGIDTLDTIHMGYSWSPWPSTRFGLELVGQNADGPNGQQDDTQFKFGAQKLF